nr:archaeosortase/exosortase family protein [Reinekea sp. G2M2-21]
MSDAAFDLHSRWIKWDEAYSHGYLLIVVCGYYIVSAVLREPVPQSSFLWRLPLLLIPYGFWAAGYAMQVMILQQISLWLAVALLVTIPMTYQGIRRVAVPLALLTLTLPVWEVLLPMLRNVTTYVNMYFVRMLHIPAYIDGYSFSLPSGTVMIANSCAGLSFFLMGVALGGINGLVKKYKFTHLVATTALLVFFSIVGNWIRVYLLILVAHYSEMQHPLVSDHGYFGWIIFSLFFLLFLFFLRWVPEQRENFCFHSESSSIERWFFILPFLILLVPIVLISSIDSNPQVKDNQASIANEQIYYPVYGGFDAAEQSVRYANSVYWNEGLLIYYIQKQGKELVSDENRLSTSGNVVPTVMFVTAEKTPFLADVIKHKGRSLLVLHTNIVGSSVAVSATETKIAQFAEIMKGNKTVALWYSSVTCKSDTCSAELNFISRNTNVVEHWISEARARL